jgi:hypothetical protein
MSPSQPGLQELTSMGYTEAQATKALQIAFGDMEQAVGFLLMGEQCRIGFDDSNPISVAQRPPADPHPAIYGATGGGRGRNVSINLIDPVAATATTAAVARTASSGGAPGAFSVDHNNFQELVAMGYDRQQAQQALSVSFGDIDQAVNFLLMGESRANFTVGLESKFHVEDDDVALATLLQQEELQADQRVAANRTNNNNNTGGSSGMYHAASMNIVTKGPRMVATESSLSTPGAGPFCCCMAASKFLSGGVVTAEFLNSILQGAVELFRKTKLSSDYNVGKVLRKFGKSHLGGIEAVLQEDVEPKQGIYIEHDLQLTLGIRKQLALCRNQQMAGWQLVLLEINEGMESFCIALPPKGSKNKFWYLDFLPRKCFRVGGAYARVHNSLLELEESLEAIFKGLTNRQTKDYASFTLYTIKNARKNTIG